MTLIYHIVTVSTVIDQEGATPTENEQQPIHPVNALDQILRSVATENFADNSRVQSALNQTSKDILRDATLYQDYFLGNAEDWQYAGTKTSFPAYPTNVSPGYESSALKALGPQVGETVIQAMLTKLGVTQSLADIESSDAWEKIPQGHKGWINILLDGKGTIVNRHLTGQYTGNVPLVAIGKSYYGDVKPGIPGVFEMSLQLPPTAFAESLHHPIKPSTFSNATVITQPTQIAS